MYCLYNYEVSDTPCRLEKKKKKLDYIIPIVVTSKIPVSGLASVANQVGLSRIFSRIFEDMFSHYLERVLEPPHDKTNKVAVCLAKTQISLGIHPVWSESSLCAQWVAEDPSFLHADSKDFDQNGRMPRLIWVFTGRTVCLLVLSWGGSLVLCPTGCYSVSLFHAPQI